MSLILVGQCEFKDILKKQIYEAIYQRIDLQYHLTPYDRQQTEEYIKRHLEYAGKTRKVFTDMGITRYMCFLMELQGSLINYVQYILCMHHRCSKEDY